MCGSDNLTWLNAFNAGCLGVFLSCPLGVCSSLNGTFAFPQCGANCCATNFGQGVAKETSVLPVNWPSLFLRTGSTGKFSDLGVATSGACCEKRSL